MTSTFIHPHWSYVASLPGEEIKAQLITGYPDKQPFESYYFPLFEPHGRVRKILDFGCGIGRNFSFLKERCEELVAFDIPEMVTACRKFSNFDGIEITDDWGSA